MSDKAKAYRVVGIDLDIDGERIPEGSEIELVAEPPRKLARWLELLELREVMEEMADDLATAGDWRLGDWDDPEASAEEDYYTERYPGA